MSSLRLTMVSLAMVSGLAACEDDSKTSSPFIPFAELKDRYAAAACESMARCYGPIFELFLNGSDCAALTAQRLDNGTFARIEDKIEQGTIVYDGSQTQACLDALSQRACSEMLQRDPPPCLKALDGTVELGDDCELDEECKGSAICQSSDAVCPGKCVGRLNRGQACRADGDCDDGLQCSKETRLCVEPAGENEPCEYSHPPCGPGLLCLGQSEEEQRPGTCRDAKEVLSSKAGATCDPNAGVLCQEGLSCVAESYDLASAAPIWRCVETGTYQANEACQRGFPEACSAGSYCRVENALTPLQGVCTAIPGAGEACGTGLGAECQTGAVCIAGLCQKYAESGVSCTGDEMCYSEYCGPTGGCEPRAPCRNASGI